MVFGTICNFSCSRDMLDWCGASYLVKLDWETMPFQLLKSRVCAAHPHMELQPATAEFEPDMPDWCGASYLVKLDRETMPFQLLKSRVCAAHPHIELHLATAACGFWSRPF
jgi:hypothetical protein